MGGGACFALIFGTVAQASDSIRINHLKSHGVFVAQNANGDEVLLDSADLRYLAGQLDVLEQTIKGLTLQQSASISYTYHSHKKGDGTASSVTLYQTTNPGGCYKSGGHTHNKTGTCSTKYTSHTHTSSCTYSVTYHGTMECTSRDGEYSYFKCNNCGRTARSYDGGASTGWGMGHCDSCATRSYTCSGVLNSGLTYACGSPVNTWVLGCGKSTSSIDEAHIVFN